MTDSFQKDLIVSHSVLNFLNADLQGSFAKLNMLSQLGYHEFNPERLSHIEKHLVVVERWIDDLSKDLPVFSTTWSTPQTVEAKEVIILLQELRGELLKLAGKVKKILVKENLQDSPDDIRFLIAALSKNAYRQDHFLRGVLEFASVRQNRPLFDQFAPMQTEAIRSLEGSHLLYSIYTSEAEPTPIFYRSLLEEAALLPGIFRSQAHEALLLSFTFKKSISLSDVEINANDIPGFEALGLPAVFAGFWQAYNITPAQAGEWINAGINQPQEAWFWMHNGFSCAEAMPWRSRGFQPPAAHEQRALGKSAEAAFQEVLTQAKEAEDQQLEQQKMARGGSNPEQRGLDDDFSKT